MWIEKKDGEQEGNQQNTLENPSIGAGAGSTPVQVQGSQTAATGNMSSTNPDPTAPGQKFGTIQDYFKGSQQQGEKLGQDFTQKLDTAKQTSQQQIGQSADLAKGKVQANTVGFDEGLVSKAVADPTKVAGSQDDFSKFMTQWDASYKGPESFEGTEEYNTAARAAADAKSKADLASSAGGRQQMLQDEFKVYGAGNKGLDEALIQQSSQFGKVGEKAKELSSLQDYLGAKSQEVGTEAQKAKEITAQTKQKTQDALLGEQGAVRQFKSDIDTRTAQERAKAAAEQKAIADAFQRRAALSDAQLQQIGLTKQQYNDLIEKEKTAGYTNLQEYLRFGNPNAQISRESVASQSDQAKDEALSKLTGGTKLLGAARENGKLVDFDKDMALQTYLNKIGADEAERERARLEREAQQRAEEEARGLEETAKRKELQSEIVGNVALPGADLVSPGLSGAIGTKINEIISKDKTASKAVQSVDKNVTQPVVDTVKSVAKSIKKAFCFDGDTMIDMKDGSSKAIKDIQLGDVTKGGIVESIRQSIAVDGTRYNYRNIIVTGSHAVKEDKWRRVKDSKYARQIEGEGKVYSLVTSDYRIFINSLEFADEHETPWYEEISMEESLRVLNRADRAVGVR